jgi:hypothetical protein
MAGAPGDIDTPTTRSPTWSSRFSIYEIVVGWAAVLTQGTGKGQDVFPALLAASHPCGRLLAKPGSGSPSPLGLVLPVTDPFLQPGPKPSQFRSRARPPELPRRNRTDDEPGKPREGTHLSPASGRSRPGARSS